MKRLLTILSQGLSILLYPLLIPTYGMIGFLLALAQQVPLGTSFWWSYVSTTFCITCLLPFTAILFLWRRNAISSLYIERAEERTTPYIYSTIGFAVWSFLLLMVHTTAFLSPAAFGATAALIFVTLINRRWKISAHLTAFGGLIGGVMSYCFSEAIMPPIWLVVVLFAVALLLMYARLYIRAHTPAQVVAGFLLGLLCTFVPYLLL